MIVDDHEDTREGFAEYLQVSGFDVLSAATAEEFEAMIASRTPDAIIMDLQLPRVDGWELARRVRETPKFRDVPMIAFSACVMPAERTRAEQVGFDLFLGKPCDPDIVVHEVRRLIDFKTAAPDTSE